METTVKLRQWVYMFYDEAAGLPEQGIAPGMRFEKLPDDWICLDCDSGKSEFFALES